MAPSGSTDVEAAGSAQAEKPPHKAFLPFQVQAPSLLAQATSQATRRLPAAQCTPLLLVRLAMLLQDAVEAACMCTRAHIDASQLPKHLLSADQYQDFLKASADEPQDDDCEQCVEDYAAAVREVVGEVRRRRDACLCPCAPVHARPFAGDPKTRCVVAYTPRVSPGRLHRPCTLGGATPS